MSDMQGRCTNLEYCSVAVSQRVVTVPEGAPFLCPKCSESLEAVKTAQRAKRNRTMLAVQALVIAVGGGAVAYKLLTGAHADHTTAEGAAPVQAEAAVVPPAVLAPGAPAAGLAPGAPGTAAATLQPAMAETPAPAEAAAAPAVTLLRMAGSDVLGARLARRLASGYLALIGDSDITTASDGGMVSVIGNQAGQREAIGIGGGGSGAGFAALLRGGVDIAMSVRAPTAAEIERLAAVGDLTSAANEHVVAVDGVAAVVSPANRLPMLTVAQLRDVFSGRMTDWSQLGAAPGTIRMVVQGGGSSGAETVADTVLGGQALATRATRLATESEVARAVAGDRLALGLVRFGGEGTARVLPIAAGGAASGAAPVEPSELSISTEDYPLTRRLYFYTAASAGNATARRFLDYVASPGGQAVVEAAGFTALTVKQAPVAVPTTASARFRQMVAGTTRVSVDFRFQPGSTQLDSRSVPDMERLIAFLRAQHVDGSRLVLAGFADSQGTAAANLQVSQRRADAVVAGLAKVGITPGRVAVFGAELPVADNATAEGRERNRRVEVYLSGGA